MPCLRNKTTPTLLKTETINKWQVFWPSINTTWQFLIHKGGQEINSSNRTYTYETSSKSWGTWGSGCFDIGAGTQRVKATAAFNQKTYIYVVICSN